MAASSASFIRMSRSRYSRRFGQSEEKNRRESVVPPSETDSLKPMRRTTLDLDSRFFPFGIKPGDLIELRGSEGSGKTFTITYLLARCLFVYSTKTVIFFDISHQFNLHNLISILSYLDPGISLHPLDMTQKKGGENLPNTFPTVSPSSPKLISYLQRLFLIQCSSAKEFLSNYLPSSSSSSSQSISKKSQIEKLLLVNSSASLILIDSLDVLSYLSDDPTKESPSILQLISNSVRSTGTPVVCSRTFIDSLSLSSAQFLNQNRKKYRTSNDNNTSSTSSTIFDNDVLPYQQLLIDDTLFTQTMSLVPLMPQPLTPAQLTYKPYLQKKRQEEGNGIGNENLRTETMAYLSRSKHGNPNPLSAIGGIRNHRLKFSIFSGMLWVCEDESLGGAEK